MKTIPLFLAISIAIVTGIAGIGIGSFLTPEYRTTMYDKYAMNLGPADRTIDLRYANSMIAHHRGAMLLAEQLKENTKRPELKALSEEILKNEPPAIDELYTWKKTWYGDTKKVRDPLVANLGDAGETFDLRFLNAIIAHHEAGIIMTKDARIKSSRTEVLDNANAVEAFLSEGIITLTNLRKNWYSL